MTKKREDSKAPIEKWSVYVQAVISVHGVLARSGQEAANLAGARVQRLVRKVDTEIYIPGASAFKGTVSAEDLKNLAEGKVPFTDEQKRVASEYRGTSGPDPKCRHCGHELSLHNKLSCHGRQGIPCFCMGFDVILPHEMEYDPTNDDNKLDENNR